MNPQRKVLESSKILNETFIFLQCKILKVSLKQIFSFARTLCKCWLSPPVYFCIFILAAFSISEISIVHHCILRLYPLQIPCMNCLVYTSLMIIFPLKKWLITQILINFYLLQQQQQQHQHPLSKCQQPPSRQFKT